MFKSGKRKFSRKKLAKPTKRPRLDRNAFKAKGVDNLPAGSNAEARLSESEIEKPHDAGDESMQETLDHKQSLNKLKDADPDFYKFLQENDKDLLNFNVSSSESDSEEQKLHTLPEKLEVASDDSDYEEEGGMARPRGVIGQMLQNIEKWEDSLNEPKPVETVIQVCKAFKTVVEKMQKENEDNTSQTNVSGRAFNNIMRLCIMHLVPAMHRILRAPKGKAEFTFDPTSSKAWTKLQTSVKLYVSQLLKVMPAISSPEIVLVLLKHMLQLIPYIAIFPKYSKTCMKKLIEYWSKGEEASRVVALLCIVRLARKLPDHLLEVTFKAMYLAYVKNCKFTSPSTWPTINFMKHSLVEVLALNQVVAYQHAFVYIRQLAIHLRNAIMIKKKDAIKTVYNWQYIHCLYFWSHFLGTLHPSPILQPLIHPLTQIITGVIKLVPSAKYIPLRYHCIRALTTLSRDTGTFIPVIPFLLEVFEVVNFNKKHSRVSWKPLNFTSALKLSKSQLDENSFKDAVVDQFYELLMDYLSIVSHLIGFPELVLTTTLQMKVFLKNIKVARYNKQIKQLLDKITENSQFVSEKRKNVSFKISDTKAVENWENQLKNENTPVLKYYTLYRKIRDKEIAMAMSQKEQLDDYELPTVNRKELMEKKKAEDRKEFKDLFAGDSESEDDVELGVETATTKTLKEKKNKAPVSTSKSPRLTVVPEEMKIKSEPEDGADEKLTKDVVAKKIKRLGLAADIVEDIRLSSESEMDDKESQEDSDSDVSF